MQHFCKYDEDTGLPRAVPLSTDMTADGAVEILAGVLIWAFINGRPNYTPDKLSSKVRNGDESTNARTRFKSLHAGLSAL